MAKLNLIFGRTEHDNVANSWRGIKVIPVEVPDELLLQCDHFSWELIGGEWEHRKDEWWGKEAEDAEV